MKFVVTLKPADVELGGTLTLLCELNQASGDVVWKHEGLEVKPGGKHCIRTDGPRRLLTVTAVSKEDEGEYSCECRNDKTSTKVSTKGNSLSAEPERSGSSTPRDHKSFDVFSAPRQVRLTAKLNNIVATEGKDAIFKCAVTPADANVTWFHKSIPVAASPKYKIERSGGSHLLTVTSVTQNDAGEISIDAEGKSCKAVLQVQRKNAGLNGAKMYNSLSFFL